MSIVTQLKELRENQSLTQEQLAQKSGVNVRTIQRIEQGKVIPRKSTQQLLIEALGYNTEKVNWSRWMYGLALLSMVAPVIYLIGPILIYSTKKSADPAVRSQAPFFLSVQILVAVLINVLVVAFVFLKLEHVPFTNSIFYVAFSLSALNLIYIVISMIKPSINQRDDLILKRFNS